MRWTEISLHVPRSLTDAVSAALTEGGCAGTVITDPRAVSSDPFAEWSAPEGSAANGDTCRVSGYLPVDDRLEGTLDEIQGRLRILKEAGLELETELTLRMVEDDAWADAWKRYFKPSRVGRRFVIKPSWEEWDAAADDLVIELDPGMAFGSGAHPTTRLCLGLLESLPLRGARVLDWGTGSGVLAIGAGRLGANPILAIDLDPLAARVAGENVERNGLEGVIECGVGSIEALPDKPAYDLIIGNIVADPIIGAAPEIRRRLAPGGHALVSGFLESREPEVRAALEATGLKTVDCTGEEDWRALLLRLA
ncbi:MAG: 50S ribosomal protein L11 methyltransferase [Armatimonadota bacterium]